MSNRAREPGVNMTRAKPTRSSFLPDRAESGYVSEGTARKLGAKEGAIVYPSPQTPMHKNAPRKARTGSSSLGSADGRCCCCGGMVSRRAVRGSRAG
eukprot:1022776-Prymnesium_polylepis.2